MAATNFNTRNDTFRKLMANGLTYQIPRFQRDYSWSAEEWEDLWLDILGTVQDGGEPAHYMGYLVLQTHDDKIFDVIDGQQRLTTLSIIVLAVLKNLSRLVDQGVDADQNRRRLDQIRQTYIGYLDPVTLVTRSKLSLNRNNDGYYQTYLAPMRDLPQRGFRASEHALRRAFEWFDVRVMSYAADQTGDKGVALASFVEQMSDRLFFTVITVTDELNAYKVFETLNARGVRLSATDLLDLLAHCASLTVNAVRSPFDRKPGAWAHADRLAEAVDLDMTGYWTPTVANYLGRVTKGRIAEAVREAVSEDAAERIGGLRKPDMASEAEALLAGKGWLPSLLRKPVPVPAEPEVQAEAPRLSEEAA